MALGYRTGWVVLADFTDETLVPFYTKLFEQEPTVYIPKIYAEFCIPGLRLGIFTTKVSNQPEFIGPSSGRMSLCIEVQSLEEAIAHLASFGYPPSGQIRTASHGREIYAYDPAGNRLILHETVDIT